MSRVLDLFPMSPVIHADHRPCIDRLFNDRPVIDAAVKVFWADVGAGANGDAQRVGITQRIKQLCLFTKTMSILTS
jgi:hypothetical protein